MRLKGLGLGRVGMKKLINSHKGRVVQNFAQGDVLCENFAQGDVLCEFRTRQCVVRSSHKTLFTRPNAKICGFQMAKILGF